ncbi:hypothetical protein PHJA_001060400 [Phtheirospermum japonicum]|uniref:Retrovirus-related Pol polyprotein from transposon RE1 n=1 Tax=Phtheirospermum japonicum TaxID=374723 RepID=A0A830BNI6_9LAMI|nr:hypothetical protein PHJA_001060400 [Phtheirospermum japonicum]
MDRIRPLLKPYPILLIPTTTPNPAYNTWLRQDKLLFGALVGTLSPTVATLVTRAVSSQAAWQLLADTYARPSRGHIHQLKDKLKHLKKGSQSISNFMLQVKTCADLLASLGKEQDPYDLIDDVINGLDESYQAVIDGLHARETPISFEELHEKIIQKELQLKIAAGDSSSSAPAIAMSMQSKSRWKPRSNVLSQSSSTPSQNYNPRPPQNPNPNLQKPNPYSNLPTHGPRPFLGKCQWCGERGHVMLHCAGFRQAAPHLRPPSQPRPAFSSPPSNQPYNPRPPQANFAANTNQSWLMDTGASHHATYDLQNLSLHYPYEGPDSLHIGDGKGLFISHVGRFSLNSRIFYRYSRYQTKFSKAQYSQHAIREVST